MAAGHGGDIPLEFEGIHTGTCLRCMRDCGILTEDQYSALLEATPQQIWNLLLDIIPDQTQGTSNSFFRILHEAGLDRLAIGLIERRQAVLGRVNREERNKVQSARKLVQQLLETVSPTRNRDRPCQLGKHRHLWSNVSNHVSAQIQTIQMIKFYN